MKLLIAFFLRYLFCWEGGDGGDGGDGDDGVTGNHPATGTGGDDEAGLLAAARANEEALKQYNTLDEEQIKTLELTDEQRHELEEKKTITFNDDQRGKLKELTTKKSDNQRPDNVPEQFWDAEKGEIKIDALLKSQADSRKAYEDLKKQQGNKKGTTVEKAEDYVFENSDEVKAVLGHELEKDDPALGLFANIAHKLGLTQEQYQEGVATFLTGAKEFMPASISIEDEMKKLGENGDAVMKSVLNWGEQLKDNGLWSEDELEEIVIMGSTATGLSALNKLREHFGGEKVIPLNAGASGELPSKEELYKAVASKEYDEDPVYRKKIDDQFKQVFGTEATGTSEPGLGVK